ncbi:MAG: HAD family hydrolase, partial [Microcoleaceae cyanobacterium]
MVLKAVLFDLDGTLANTNEIHFHNWQELLAVYDISLDHAGFDKYISGRTNSVIIADLLPQLTASEGEKLAILKEEKFRQEAVNIQPINGLMKFIDWVKSTNLKTALVTNAPIENVEFMLTQLKLENFFQAIVLGGELARGKPDPLAYQVSLEKLGIESNQAIVLEDSPTGIQAGVGANIYTIGILSTHPAEALIKAGANLLIQDFHDPQLWDIV